ncbi:hypothetical protein IV38_GL000863 [Lactobacillus selangorensis]|uniref:WxL domain-containing protein n=2 Tax=Lactobacillus selangorensis TaxID=81857 RepID=A0A0R2FV08_9LACO|nr:hypothetical protein IV38_GL000863 [Lactobacillus selangorensis]KRN32930.1 hypothetical protein IV40_GL000990 [Lactobacillus selangorensis]
MQNDPRGEAALTSAAQDSRDGQTLGVYGGGSYSYGTSSIAIKNSVAIEFDLNSNQNAGTDGQNFDSKVTSEKMHLAYSFPGDAASYSNPDGDRAVLNHYGTLSLDGTQNGNWYEFHYAYDHSSGNFTYYLKDPGGTTQTAVTTIPSAALEKELQLSANNNQAYWGFTAADGAVSGQTKIAFADLPIVQDISLTNDVQNSAGKSIVVPADDETKEPSISKNDTAQFKAAFHYTANSATTLKGFVTNFETAVVKLPKALSTTANAPTLTITHSDGTTTVISGSDLNATVSQINQKITFLPNSPVTIKNGDQLELSVTLPMVTTLTADTKTYFTSHVTTSASNVETTTPGNAAYFWVTTGNPTTLTWDDTDSTVKNKIINVDQLTDLTTSGSDWIGTFYWQDKDITPANATSEFNVIVKKDGTILNNTGYSLSSTAAQNGFYKGALHIRPEYFADGVNTFTIAIYPKGVSSGTPLDTLTVTFNVGGDLSFEVLTGQSGTDPLSWTDRTVSETKSDALARDADNTIQFKVDDARQADRNWAIHASTTTVDGAAAVPFSLGWRDAATGSLTDLATNPIVFSSTSGGTVTGNLTTSKTWSNDAGVLIDSPDYLSVGDYSNRLQVNWRLYNTSNPE